MATHASDGLAYANIHPLSGPNCRQALAMITKGIRQVAQKFGLDIHRHSSEWRWSHDVHDYYPVDPAPRWGHGKPVHPEIQAIMKSQCAGFARQLAELSGYKKFLSLIPNESPADEHAPSWSNGWFRDFDAATLVTFLAAARQSLGTTLAALCSSGPSRCCHVA